MNEPFNIKLFIPTALKGSLTKEQMKLWDSVKDLGNGLTELEADDTTDYPLEQFLDVIPCAGFFSDGYDSELFYNIPATQDREAFKDVMVGDSFGWIVVRAFPWADADEIQKAKDDTDRFVENFRKALSIIGSYSTPTT